MSDADLIKLYSGRILELAAGRGRDHAWSPGLLTQEAEEAQGHQDRVDEVLRCPAERRQGRSAPA